MTSYLADAEGQPIDFERYSALKQDEQYCRVGWTEVGGVTVSTIWFGIPMLGLFETMVLRDGEWGSQTRWDTRDAAEIGHNLIVLTELPDEDVTPEMLTELWRWS